ncbi:hypothetical protein Tco_1102776 [Tanacetum coccineum]
MNYSWALFLSSSNLDKRILLVFLFKATSKVFTLSTKVRIGLSQGHALFGQVQSEGDFSGSFQSIGAPVRRYNRSGGALALRFRGEIVVGLSRSGIGWVVAFLITISYKIGAYLDVALILEYDHHWVLHSMRNCAFSIINVDFGIHEIESIVPAVDFETQILSPQQFAQLTSILASVGRSSLQIGLFLVLPMR